MSDVAPRAGTATVLFTDLVASTYVRQQLGDERADDLRRAHDRILREAIAGHGGTEVKGTGDGLMATFNAAAEAVSAAVTMQRGIVRLARRSPVPIAIRVGISAGDVAWEGNDCFGTPVVEASRLCNAAESGAILVSEVVRLLAGSRGGHVFRSVGALELKGLDAALSAAEVDWGAPADERLPLPAVLGGAHIVSFVGRAAERDRLRTAWKEAAEGAVKLVLISGEPGVGKTRLASELALQVHDEGAVVLFGRCDEDLAVPYQPFVEALRDYVAAAEADDLAEQVATFGGDLARIVPLLAERFPTLPEALRADPETERYRLFEAVAAFLRGIATEAPLLLVLDDLHWAGRPELLLLRHVLRGPPAPILIVGTYRDTDLDRRHPLAEVLSELRRDDALDRVNLTGLDEAEVTEFLEAAAGGALGHDGALLSREVHEETEGNPFFVGQVLRHLVETGAVVEVDGQWVRARGAAGSGIPEGIREVIGRRLAMLSNEANHLLAAASVLGREFVVDVVREATDADVESVLDAMEEAEAAHVIEPVPGAPKSRTFVHALFRSTLYEEIPTTRRLRLHRRVAQALEARGPGEALPLNELARHYCEAAALGEASNAVRYSTAAAEQAREGLAYEEAATLYERALAVLDPSAPGDYEARSRLLLALGRVRWAAGDRDAAFAALLESGDIARERGDAELFAEAAIARGGKRGWSEAGVVDETLVRLLEESLTVLPDGDHPLRAVAMARLASELYFLVAEADRRSRLTAEAVAMARRCCEEADLAVVLSSAHWGGWVPGNAAERLAIAEEMLELGLASHDREIEVSARIWAVPDLVELQRGEEAAAAVEHALALADELRLPEYQWGARVQKTCMLLMKGAYGEAETCAQAALEFGQGLQTETATQMFGVVHLHLTRARGGIEEMEPLVLAMVERYPLIPAWRTGLALVYAELERDDDLRAQVDLLTADDFGLFPRDANWMVAHVILAWACAYLGDGPRCAELYERLLPLAPYAVTVGSPADCLGSVESFLAPLCVVLGRFDEAEAHLRVGLEASEAMGNAAGAATASYVYALTLLRHGGPERSSLARDAMTEAAARAEALGMPRIAARARARLEASAT